MGNGLQRILKMHGKINVIDSKGKRIVYVWDYANNKARVEGEMTQDELAASEKAKWEKSRDSI